MRSAVHRAIEAEQEAPGAAAQAWSKPAGEVVAEWGSSVETGLSEREARHRLRGYGPNQLREPRAVTWLELLRNQLKSVIVWLLLSAAGLSFAVGDNLEGSAIVAAIVLTVVVGFLTELRAVRSMEALRRLGTVRARIRRDRIDRLVPAWELVPGDIVLFEGGDSITADARVVEASKLQADESALTGESVPVGKHVEPLPQETLLADRKNLLYKGATITRGSGVGVVVATGMSSEIGRIAALVEETEDETTPLEKRLAALGQKLVWLCLAIAAITSAIGIASGRGATLMIKTGIALAIAAIPEGLPVVATIALARGLWRLAARHALIKRLSAVETLGATSVIVADKTGTLTENRLSVVALRVGEDEYRVDGAIQIDSQPVDMAGARGLNKALEIAVLCNNASLSGEHPSGDPLEIALLRAGRLADMTRDDLISRWPEMREEAFDPDVKMMATVHRDRSVIGRGDPGTAGSGSAVRVAVKGAPESVLAASAAHWQPGGAQPLTDRIRRSILDDSERMARSGLRVLAVAEKSTARPDVDVYRGLTFVGLVGLADPPRREVLEPIAACRRAGIRVVMATGDQPATAASIATAVGIMGRGDTAVVSGADLAKPAESSAERRRALLSAPVFARVTPEQKLHIIDLYQDGGEIVAMTGDGVNDAPALRKAAIGIAMGLRGTEVAREAAEMVLEDDSFESIVLAVEQGRAIFENIRRFVIYLLSCNLSEILVVSGAILVGAPLPLLPLQILFLNLVTDVFPALALGFGKGDPNAMTRPPRDAREPIVTRQNWAMIAGYAALITGSTLAAMALVLNAGATRQVATSVTFLTLGFTQLWHVFNMRGRGSDAARNDVVRSPWVWGAIALCVVLLVAAALVPGLARVLHVAPLGAFEWTVIIGMSLVPLLVGQLVLGHATASGHLRQSSP